MSVKGYKVFNSDWTCRGFQYAVGETFRYDGDIEIHSTGFHFCTKIADCFNYYRFDSSNKVAEIEAIGDVITDGDKSVTNEIRIIREISWHEVLELANTGYHNTGYHNTGDYNTGYRNSGDHNTGYHNTGDYNSGDYNTGYHNTGDYNSGDYNSGDYNSGNCNSGNYNSGSYNSGNYNSGDWNGCSFSTGFFNSVSQPIYAFNKPLNMERGEFYNCKGIQILYDKFSLTQWIDNTDMTDEEKEKHPDYKTTGGYLKTLDFKTACKRMWEKLTKEERKEVCRIPNFDADVFEEITGIDVGGV